MNNSLKNNETALSGFLPFFDWYAASFSLDFDHEEFLTRFAFLQGEAGVYECRPCRDSFSYGFCVKKSAKDEKKLLLLSIGDEKTGIHVQASGRNAPILQRFLEENYAGEYGASRVDVAIDFSEPGLFDEIAEFSRNWCRSLKLNTWSEGDWLKNDTGRTLYIGSRRSQYMIRIYEKGRQLRDQKIDPDADLDWVRVELEVKPHSRKKKQAALFSPTDFLCASRVYSRFFERLGLQRYNCVSLSYQREASSSLDRKVDYMLFQYGPALNDLAKRFGGDWGQMGQYLFERLPEARRVILTKSRDGVSK